MTEIDHSKYICRYRDKYPDDYLIPDNELIKTSDYIFFVFNTSVSDIADGIVKELKPHIDRVLSFTK